MTTLLHRKKKVFSSNILAGIRKGKTDNDEENAGIIYGKEKTIIARKKDGTNQEREKNDIIISRNEKNGVLGSERESKRS